MTGKLWMLTVTWKPKGRRGNEISSIEVIAFTPAVARHFARLRALHPMLRPPDAMQLASALHTQAAAFVTNDGRLASISLNVPLRVIALGEWETLRTPVGD